MLLVLLSIWGAMLLGLAVWLVLCMPGRDGRTAAQAMWLRLQGRL